MTYTWAQILAGEGFFANGRWTVIWLVGPDQYVTAERNDVVRGGRIVAGGRRTAAGVHIVEC